MEEVRGTTTPDRVSGYDLTLNNLTAADLVDGKSGKAFSFANAKQTLLSRVHGANDDLPANKHEAFTITMWAKIPVPQTDLRLFSEAFTPNNNNPLFNLGTHTTGANGAVDTYFRNGSFEAGTHQQTTAEPFDDTWHHITFVQAADGTRKLYVDGALDDVQLLARPAGSRIPANDTTIGGILRASPSHWVTGLIDEVAIWKRALSDAEVAQVKNEGLVSVFPPEATDLVAHWPMDEVQGGKTPDVVSGYDLTLNNLTAADLVDGKSGKAFSFANAKQTLLSRVHGANDDLPANKHEAFTITMWAKIPVPQTDLRLFSEAFTPNNNNPLFNLGTHTTGANGAVDTYFRNGSFEAGTHQQTTAEPFDDTWHHITFVQAADGTRKLYVDGALDDVQLLARPAGSRIPANDTTIGGILRASPSHWVTGLIDEVAIWKRALSDAEITKIKTDGVPRVFVKPQPLEIKKFLADFPAAATGDSVTLRWESNKDATLTITPGVGDVTGASLFGVGSKSVTVSGTTTYTLTATRGEESVTKQIEVKAVAGVAAGWHLLDTFEFYNPGALFGQSFWLGAEGAFNVVDLGGNKAIGYDDGADLTAIPLNALTINEGQKGTLSFRVYVPVPAAEDPVTALSSHVGLTERSIRFNGDFNQNVGPYVRVERIADGTTIDLLARNGVATQTYEGMAVDAFVPGNWYRLWIDVENRAFNVTDGIQNGGDLYSVYIQKDGDAARTALFENYLADRDAVNIDPALGAPTQHLTHLFISVPGTGQGANKVLFDDFFLSHGAYNATVPYVPVFGPTVTSTPPSGLGGTELTGVAHDLGSKTITADIPANGASGFLTITPAVQLLSVTVENGKLVIKYQ